MLEDYFLIIFLLFSPAEHVLSFAAFKAYYQYTLKECALSIHNQVIILPFTVVNNN